MVVVSVLLPLQAVSVTADVAAIASTAAMLNTLLPVFILVTSYAQANASGTSPWG